MKISDGLYIMPLSDTCDITIFLPYPGSLTTTALLPARKEQISAAITCKIHQGRARPGPQ